MMNRIFKWVIVASRLWVLTTVFCGAKFDFDQTSIVRSYKILRKKVMIPVLIKSANIAPMMGTMRKGLTV